MAVMFDRRAYAEMSTVDVPVGDAFAYWRELICATFVRLTAEPVGDGQFRGRIEHVPCGDVELSTVVANSQIVRRTRALIQRDNEEYLLSSIQLDGRLRIEQDGRIAVLSAGDMAFYDSTRPYSLQSDEPSSQLVIQVPKRELSICDTRRLTARTLGSGTPAVAVSAFLTFLRDAARHDATHTAILVPHTVGLLDAAASFAASTEPGARAADALARQRVSDFLHRNFADPWLDARAVAHACNVSRRSLYRLVGADGVAAQLRRVRIQRAKQMLIRDPQRPIASVAAACGFESESGFHRAFREATGQTPGDYREAIPPIG
jgi:AraC-like DNA-binding protein